MYTVSITSQGQLTMPAPIRKMFGLDRFKKANVFTKGEEIIIRPTKDFFALKASLKTPKKPLSSRDLRERFARYQAAEAVGKSR